MSGRTFRERLRRRLEKTEAPRLSDGRIAQAEAYIELLRRWNQKINLTSLSLDPLTDDAIDRLLVEPIAAARYLASFGGEWIDLGSGGGSPAIPLRIAGLDARLTMVESKVRKAAFLREAIRVLTLDRVEVANERVEEVALSRSNSAELLTVRAVRLDKPFVEIAAQLLSSDGSLATFSLSPSQARLAGFGAPQSHHLIEAKASYINLYARTFHVEQTR